MLYIQRQIFLQKIIIIIKHFCSKTFYITVYKLFYVTYLHTYLIKIKTFELCIYKSGRTRMLFWVSFRSYTCTISFFFFLRFPTLTLKFSSWKYEILEENIFIFAYLQGNWTIKDICIEICIFIIYSSIFYSV